MSLSSSTGTFYYYCVFLIVRKRRGTLIDETLGAPEDNPASGFPVSSSISGHISNNVVIDDDSAVYDEVLPQVLPEPDHTQINSHNGKIDVVGQSVRDDVCLKRSIK